MGAELPPGTPLAVAAPAGVPAVGVAATGLAHAPPQSAAPINAAAAMPSRHRAGSFRCSEPRRSNLGTVSVDVMVILHGAPTSRSATHVSTVDAATRFGRRAKRNP